MKAFQYRKAICYSGYRENQSPRKDIYPSKEEIYEDLKILETNYTDLRLFDCSEHAYKVLDVICTYKMDFKVMLGLSLDAEANFVDHPFFPVFSEDVLESNKQNNQLKIQEIIDLANRYDDIVSSISIGNEVQSPWVNNLVTEERLIEAAQAIQKNTHKPVTFCEEYQLWIKRLDSLAKQLDFISMHTYPAWRNVPIEEAFEETKQNYLDLKKKYPNKDVIITETGWPTKSHGAKIKVEDATIENQKAYVQAIDQWAKENDIMVYLFEAFDEPWKGGDHPDEPEKHWGLYDIHRKKKW